MKIAKLAIVVLFVAASMLASQPARATTCTVESFQGVYGINTVGVGLDTSGNPVTSIYQVTADGKGKVTGLETKDFDGSNAMTTLSGTYTINPNCTGTTVFKNENGQTEHYRLVLNDSNNGAFLFQTDSGTVQTAVAVAQGTIATCSDTTMARTYSFELSGVIPGGRQVALAGQLVLKEKEVSGGETGSITGSLDLSNDGIITPSSVTGRYSVNSNCTATMSITFSGANTIDLILVLVDGGAKALAIDIDDDAITGWLQE
jgi:hypothetical protein